MVLFNIAKLVGLLAVKRVGDVFIKGLKNPACPHIFRQSAENMAQANHSLIKKLERLSGGASSDVPVAPLEQEHAMEAGARFVAEVSAYAVVGTAAFFGIKSLIELWATSGELSKEELEEIKTEVIRMIEYRASKQPELLVQEPARQARKETKGSSIKDALAETRAQLTTNGYYLEMLDLAVKKYESSLRLAEITAELKALKELTSRYLILKEQSSDGKTGSA